MNATLPKTRPFLQNADSAGSCTYSEDKVQASRNWDEDM